MAETISDADLSGIPFGGANQVMSFYPGEEPLFRLAIFVLMDCNHQHNFMVAQDGTRLYLSELGVGCVKEALGL